MLMPMRNSGSSAHRHSPRRMTRAHGSSAFTLVELLIMVAIVALLLAVMLPGLSGARAQSRQVVCGSNLRQIGLALHLYAIDYGGRAMPLAYTAPSIVGSGPAVYWWGTNAPSGIDPTRGFVWPYLRSTLHPESVFECPDQPWGTYKPQGAAPNSPTSTYGYNGYYLSPQHTPGWGFQIGFRPWQMLSGVREPARVFAFGDTLVSWSGGLQNNALLEPPMLLITNQWRPNPNPTTAFRHRSRAQIAHVDGHVELYGPGDNLSAASQSAGLWKMWTEHRIASVDRTNDPHYVPDWQEW